MTFFPNMSIQRKQTIIMMVTTSVALLLVCAALTVFEIFTFRHQITDTISTYASIAGNNVSAALDFNDLQAAQDTLNALQAEPDIIGASVYAADGSLFAKYSRKGTSFVPPTKIQQNGGTFVGDRLELFQPVVSKGQVIGTIYLESDTRELRSRLTQYLSISLIALLVTLVISLVLSNRLQGLVCEPILNLAHAAREVAEHKNYSIRVQRPGNDEIGVLIDGFNAMLAQIQERDANLERRVGERTQELAQSLSILNATLGSTTDGILVVSPERKTILRNRRFAELMKIPEDILNNLDGEKRLEWVTKATKNPDEFLAKVSDLYSHPDKRSRDEIELKDGTIMEQISGPVLGDDNKIYGRIWTFRDITERKRAEAELHESQALYHSLVEQMPAGIFRKDAAGRYVLVNTWFCKLWGINPEDVIGKTPKEVATTDVLKNEADTLHQGAGHHEIIMRTGKVIEETEDHFDTRGQMRHMQAIKTPVFNVDGKTVGSQGILMDITERKRAEAALAYEQYLLNALLDNSDDKIYFKDLESKFIRCSFSMAKTFDVRKSEELVGKSDQDFFGGEHAQAALTDEQNIIRTGQPIIGKMEKETWPDGRITWALTTKMALRDPDGNIAGTFGVSKDVTPLKEAEEKLEQAHRQLVDTSRQAGMAEVATSVLHNVGNVLNSANVSTSLIAEKVRTSRVTNISKLVALVQEHEKDLGNFFTNDPKGKQLPAYLAKLAEYLAQEREEVLNEVNSLVNNIIHIKEIVAMQQSYAKASGVLEKLKATDLVEDALRMNSGAMSRHNINVVREFNAAPDVTTDKHKVLQILVNLIRNAKYACDDSGREDKQIKLRIWNGNDTVKISVIDNGIGIAPENLTRIFNHGFTTRKEGHGFGLHSGANAARELKGSLTVSSEGVGHGAAFTLELPLNEQENRT